LRVKLEGALGIPLPLDASGVNVELNGCGFLKGCRVRFRGVILAAHDIQDARFGFQVSR
jgi:hypothetical protein